MRDAFSIRLADGDDADAIRDLVTDSKWTGSATWDWRGAASSWIVAETGGRVVGCLTPIPTKPIGHVEHMGLDSSLTGGQRARVVSLLMAQALSLLKRAGCEAAMTTVPDELASYVQVLERRGAQVVNHANVMIKRLV